MQTSTTRYRNLDLNAIVKSLCQTADGCIDTIERLAYLGVIIVDIDNRSHHGTAALSQRTCDVISGQRADSVGALRLVDEVESWTDG